MTPPEDSIAVETKAGKVQAAGPNLPLLVITILFAVGALWVVRSDSAVTVTAIETNVKVMEKRDEKFLDKLDILIGIGCAQLRQKSPNITQKGCL